jgi:DNA (cytosine-5)-methyltransferase 1
MGFARAGFDVVGVDCQPQPYYPFEFVQADVLSLPDEWFDQFDAIAASPPCQHHSQMQSIHNNKHEHEDLIEPTRELLKRLGKPYVIENVEGARSKLIDPVTLCGTTFGLAIAKHRCFEASFPIEQPAFPCDHSGVYDPWHGKGRTAAKLRAAMGIDWLPTQGGASRLRGETGDLYNAIPPPFAHWIGERLIVFLNNSSHSSDYALTRRLPAFTSDFINTMEGTQNAYDRTIQGFRAERRRLRPDPK